MYRMDAFMDISVNVKCFKSLLREQCKISLENVSGIEIDHYGVPI